MSQQIVHVGIYDGFADWEMGYVMARVNDDLWHKEPGRYAVRTVGETLDPIVTTGGLRLTPDLTLAGLSPADSAMLILPGSATWDSGANVAMADMAAKFLAAGVPVAAICGATFGLANAGLLDDRPHTSSALEYLQFAPGYKGAAHYRDERAVIDGDLITGGAADVLEFTRLVLLRLGVFTDEVLEAWYQLNVTGDAKWYGQIVAATAQ
jgi:putative intracellular protease/amidase